ncbi:hypothetical protein [Providencia rustigianii]|uniref:hypothetical protein n=1 Tax=Providencia rustigianii TaxID=158850 RepID=UPI000F828321|nr:hypothetical protein [Providencia rustigianii]
MQQAIEYAELQGWFIVMGSHSSHCYAKLRCGIEGHQDHMLSIWSTPRNPENHAKQIKRMVDKCSPQ